MDNATAFGKKTIQPNDVLVSLKDSEFEFMIPRIEAELKSTFVVILLFFACVFASLRYSLYLPFMIPVLTV